MCVATDAAQQNRVSELFLHGEGPTFQTTCDAWSEQDTGENGETIDLIVRVSK